jgi:hypothetical protein
VALGQVRWIDCVGIGIVMHDAGRFLGCGDR